MWASLIVGEFGGSELWTLANLEVGEFGGGRV